MSAGQPVIQLVQIPVEDLPAMERGLVPTRLAGRVLPDGLPPAAVARRTRAHLQAGKPARWVSMYYILDADGCCVGGCGFKDVPRDREVEIGYGMATARRGQGYASAALQQLVRIAAASGELDSVVAHIAPENAASQRVAARAGFVAGETILEEGEWVVRWRRLLSASDAEHHRGA